MLQSWNKTNSSLDPPRRARRNWCNTQDDPCIGAHASEEGSNQLIPKLKDGFVGTFPWDTTERDCCRFDNLDACLNAVGLKEEIEMGKDIALLVG